jgi:hypothetical protein
VLHVSVEGDLRGIAGLANVTRHAERVPVLVHRPEREGRRVIVHGERAAAATPTTAPPVAEPAAASAAPRRAGQGEAE